MKVTAERIPEAQVVLEIELDPEQVRKSLDQAAKRLAQRYRIQGFRKGKAPRRVIESRLGADAIYEEAFERLIPKAYDAAVEEQGLEPVGQPELEILDRDPVRFKATVPIKPVVDLGEYKSIAVTKGAVELTDEMMEDALLEIRRRHAVIEPVERAIAYDDRVRLDISAEADGKQVLNEQGVEFNLREGVTVALPGLAEQLVGLEPGPAAELSVDVADDYDDEEVAGKTVTFSITVLDVKQEILPEPDDDLAAEVGEFETFADLRKKLSEDLLEGTEQRVSAEFHDALLQAVIDAASIEFAPVMADHELEHMMVELAQQAGLDLEAYIQRLGAEAPALRMSLRPRAVERVVRSLILSRVAETESIEVTEADIEAEIDRIVGDGPNSEPMRAAFHNENGREMIRRNLLTTQTLDRLGEIAETNAAAAAETTAGTGTESDQSETATGEAESETAEPEAAEDDEAGDGAD